jgi:pimeloyl-ACP methyl ester carboxylesterase
MAAATRSLRQLHDLNWLSRRPHWTPSTQSRSSEMFRTVCAVAVAALAATAGYASAAEKPVSIVLVHGAFVDASGWQKVYTTLTKDGYQVLVVQNSTASLEGDVATTERAIHNARHTVVLVGHSYGGMIISEAGNDPKVRCLVYIAAYAPDKGESVVLLTAKPIPGYAPVPILPPQDGYLTVDISKFPRFFAADVDLTTTRFMAASQVPWGLAAVTTKIGEPAWKTKPTYYMITTEDHMIPTPQQREMAARAHAHTVEIASSHAVMLSHPNQVAAFIETSAAAPQ